MAIIGLFQLEFDCGPLFFGFVANVCQTAFCGLGAEHYDVLFVEAADNKCSSGTHRADVCGHIFQQDVSVDICQYEVVFATLEERSVTTKSFDFFCNSVFVVVFECGVNCCLVNVDSVYRNR